MKKIPNQGMISMETHHTGDLFIQFMVEFPPMNFFHDQSILQKLESLLPAKLVLNIPSGINLDEASAMIDHKKEPSSHKHRSHQTGDESDEDDDDQYIDEDDDDDDDDEPHAHSCQTH
jgi:DnaJ-class molecular chaperone